MLSPARFLRLHRRLLSSSSSTSFLFPSPNPNPKPFFGKPLRSLVTPILRQHDPDALVSLFNLASADPRFRLHAPIYDLAVRRLSAAGRPDAVESLIEHQKSHPNFTQSEGFAARLVLLYGRAHMLPHALSTYKSLKCPRTTLSFNSLLSGYARADPVPNPARIAGLIQEIQSSFPDVTPNVVSYNIVVSTLCEKDELKLAMEVVKHMEMNGISPNLITYNTLLHGFYSNGRFDDGEKIWEKMEEKDVRSYNSRLRGLASQRGTEDAVKVFDEMKGLGLKPDVYSFNPLIKGYCQDGRLDEAKTVYLRLLEEKCNPDVVTFQTLIPAVWEAKDYDFTVRLCNEAMNVGCYLDVELLQGVVDGLAKEEMFKKAKKLVKHARSRSFYGGKYLRMPLPCLAM